MIVGLIVFLIICLVFAVAVAGFSLGRMWTQKQMQDLLYEVLREVEESCHVREN